MGVAVETPHVWATEGSVAQVLLLGAGPGLARKVPGALAARPGLQLHSFRD